jgi:uncharacterized membrane protein YcaP (DUF421 family)
MFEFTIPWWEPVVRVALLYTFLLVMVRLTGRRQMAQLTPMDLLTMLLVAETVSPALTGGDDSVSAAAVAAGTLFALTVLMAWLTYSNRTFERLTEGVARTLAKDGNIDQRVMRGERITLQELETALRKSGLQSVTDIDSAIVEPDGQITFSPRGN